MKPIEPGCRAVTVNAGSANGKIVNVIRPIGIKKVEDYKGVVTYENVWEIEEKVTNYVGEITNYMAESQLQRIDDYDGNDVISWEDKRCVWQPERVVA